MQNASRFARSVLSTGLILSGLLLAAMLSAPVSAASGTSTVTSDFSRSITVTGNGRVKVKPNTAQMSFSINSLVTGKASEAQAKNAETFQEVKSALADLGIAKEDIQITWTNIMPDFNYDGLPEGTQLTAPNAYRFEQQFQVEVHDLDKVEQVTEKLMLVENVLQQNVNYVFEDDDFDLSEVRKKAVQNALEKAQSLGELLKFNVGKIMTVTENSYYPGGYYYGGGSQQEVEITLDVMIMFELLTK